MSAYRFQSGSEDIFSRADQLKSELDQQFKSVLKRMEGTSRNGPSFTQKMSEKPIHSGVYLTRRYPRTAKISLKNDISLSADVTEDVNDSYHGGEPENIDFHDLLTQFRERTNDMLHQIEAGVEPGQNISDDIPDKEFDIDNYGEYLKTVERALDKTNRRGQENDNYQELLDRMNDDLDCGEEEEEEVPVRPKRDVSVRISDKLEAFKKRTQAAMYSIGKL